MIRPISLVRFSTWHSVFYCLLLMLYSCTNEPEKQDNKALNTIETENSAVLDSADQTGAKSFLQSLPNTLHLAQMFKRSGMDYVPGLAHKPADASAYVDPTSQSLNLGVFSADMGYHILHNHNTDALKTLKAIKTLSEALQLNMLYETGPWIDRIDKNLNNTDSVIAIMSELQMQSDVLLRDNARFDVLYLSFAGAFTESLYLATQLETRKPNAKLIKRIAEQSMPLGKLIVLIEGLDNQERYQILLGDLKSVYDMMVKLNSAQTDADPEKAHRIAMEELYPQVAKVRSRIIAKD